MKDPVVSIIVPIYNSEQYLPQCLDSILSQTYTDFELLLVDDGSKDQSGAICDEYAMKDPRVRVFHKENGGVSAARNLALQEARGKYICFCDSDDEMMDCYLQTLVSVEEKTDADMVVGSYRSYVVHTKRTHIIVLKDRTYEKDKFGIMLYDLRKKGSLGVPWNKLFKTNIIRDHHITFDITLDSYEDEVFNLEYLQYAGKVTSTSVIVYNYILRSNMSLSQRFIELNKHLQIASIIFHLDSRLVKDNKSLEWVKLNYMSHYADCISWLYLRKNRISRKERFFTMEKVLCNIPRGYGKYFRTACRRKYIYSRNKYIIDLSMRALVVLKKILGRL